MKKLLKNNVLGILLVIFIFVLIFVTIFTINHKLNNVNVSDTKVEKTFTVEQRQIYSEIRIAREELENIKQELQKSKDEIYQLANQAKASVISKDLNPDIHTDWLVHGMYNDSDGKQYNLSVIVKNKPVLWGFRADGIVLWKAQE